MSAGDKSALTSLLTLSPIKRSMLTMELKSKALLQQVKEQKKDVEKIKLKVARLVQQQVCLGPAGSVFVNTELDKLQKQLTEHVELASVGTPRVGRVHALPSAHVHEHE
ncbi:hypothetical protein F441_05420 [Phytophthora nicotianae CJ01A1]|uniref:Uncharacterized protein n=6 Tax=Phytophthora nicotianae TaxID=4792 RepID=W2QFI3_PHYN3|nr:hypothetical protein PPTG_09587 [Phytophthora nicotianae INRA-310]ETI51214.1 hypothetical protein F443_05414 [Phytophthora nicotianae P1569]ETK91052.1 hypothetical protein L915_05271 [Phytophthora nicotianae]ETO79956.1 hypothetical protein F444_05459 [Phytophthora nicotianae P1976]ETP20976.1 hypothetical protein F441_05420 [Phytophthora nicotianae CJ01A1]ETP48930.1 hypothetical protein F442_05463 [Phytophthora nicotianae P10297]